MSTKGPPNLRQSLDATYVLMAMTYDAIIPIFVC